MILFEHRHVQIFVILVFAATASLSLYTMAFAQAQLAVPPNRENAQQSTTPAVVKIRVADGRVTAEIRNAPLQDVLEELAARSGVVFEIETQQNPMVSQVLDKEELPEAIKRILGNTSDSIFKFTKDAGGGDVVGLVRIFPRDNEPQQPALRFIGLGKVTKTGEEAAESPEQAATILAESRDLEQRQKAIELLALSRSDLAIQALMNALSDPAPEIKAAAIDGLAGQGSNAALPRIVLALKDKHPGVRQSAIAAIVLLGNAGNVKDLKPLSRDSDASVAMAAEMAIRKLSAQQ
jgi:hypothetical protein